MGCTGGPTAGPGGTSVDTMPESPPSADMSHSGETAPPTGRVRLVVLFGGQSAEHDVSCVSARHVIAAADPEKYLIEPIGIGRDGTWHRDTRTIEVMAGGRRRELPERLTVEGPEVDAAGVTTDSADNGMPTVVFPVLHGPMGEDGTVQGLLELADVPYVGAGVLASALCMDKVAAKAQLSAHGIAQGEYTWVTVDAAHSPDAADPVAFPDGTTGTLDEAARRAVTQLGLPLFVKPANMGSSVGVSRSTTSEKTAAAIELAAGYDRIVIIEEAVRGREIEVAVLGNENPVASVPGEILPGADFYDYDDKYDDGAELLIPAPLGPEEVAAARAAAIAAYRALRVEGLSRVDFFYEDGRGWLVNELNTMPGFTPISMYPKLWAESGLPYEDLIDQLVELARQRHDRRHRHQRTDR